MEYDKIYLVYDAIKSSDSMYSSLQQLLSLSHNASNIRNISNSIYHRQGRLRHLGPLISTDAVKYLESTESRVLHNLITELNEYITYLQSYRSSDSRILTLVAILVFNSLQVVVSKLIMPDHLLPVVRDTLNLLSDRSHKLLTDTQQALITESPAEESYVLSLSTSLLMQRTDQVISLLINKYGEEMRSWYDYIAEQRYYYLKLVGEIDRKLVFNSLGLSSSTYFRTYSIIMNEFVTKLTGESQNYLSTLLIL